MKFLTRVMVLALALALSACASNRFTKAHTLVKNVNLKNSNLYVYSFLDIREEEFGPKLLAEFDMQFMKALAKSGINLKLLRFKNSEMGRYTALTPSSAPIPVKETIAKNEGDEKYFGADYRLVIFPSTMHVAGGARHYSIRWDLFNSKSGQMVWSGASQGRHANLLVKDEQSEERAKLIVEGVLSEMEKSGLLDGKGVGTEI